MVARRILRSFYHAGAIFPRSGLIISACALAAAAAAHRAPRIPQNMYGKITRAAASNADAVKNAAENAGAKAGEEAGKKVAGDKGAEAGSKAGKAAGAEVAKQAAKAGEKQ
jgi:hypothetical protein